MRQTGFRLVLALTVPIAFQGLAYLILSLLGLAGEAYSDIPPNIAALIGCVVLIRVLALSARDIGLRRIQGRFRWHVVSCTSLLLFLMMSDLFVVRISGLRPGSSRTVFGLLNYLVVSFWEEIYFRGICYAAQGKRFIALFWDKASWHTSKKTRRWIRTYNRKAKQSGLPRLLVSYHPTRSPWLMPLESVFGWVKHQVLGGRFFQAMSELQQAVELAFRQRVAQAKKRHDKAVADFLSAAA